MNPLDLIQGSSEWKAYKCGRLGASSIGDMLVRTKTGWGSGRDKLKAKLVIERLNGKPTEGYVNDAMRKGMELEPVARKRYEFVVDQDVTQVGWMDHAKVAWSGCSPDGLISTDGLLEIKCPTEPTHLATLMGAPIDGFYLKQMAWQMAVTGRQWCDFASFCPAFPEEMQLKVIRVRRDDVVIANLELEAIVFLKEVETTVDQLRSKYQLLEAAE